MQVVDGEEMEEAQSEHAHHLADLASSVQAYCSPECREHDRSLKWSTIQFEGFLGKQSQVLASLTNKCRELTPRFAKGTACLK